MNTLRAIFIILATVSTIIFLYSMGLIVFYEYERYLHNVATYSLVGLVIGIVFASMFEDSQTTGKVKA